MKPFGALNTSDATTHFDTYFKKHAQQRSPPAGLQVRIQSDKLNLDYHFATGAPDQPWHVASIGKVFTATLIAQLVERGVLRFSDPIARYLPDALLRGLFVHAGVDHARQVTIEQLLGHTSGIADYFEGAVRDGSRFMQEILAHPDRFWKPADLVGFTRERQGAVGAPGAQFHYSDTGYILLGLLIEAVTGSSFHQNLHNEIFSPLDMQDSWLMFYSQPVNPHPEGIERIWFNKTEISTFTSLSCDWAGGGVVTTSADLIKFQRALQSGKLINRSALEHLETPRNKFRSGIHYCLGMMEIRFEGFFFLLRGLPRLKGHIGVLATHMFYDPVHDAHIVMNFGNSNDMTTSFKALITIENTLRRLR